MKTAILKPTTAATGWVLYDGECSLCTRWARRCAALLHRRGFELAPLQTGWVSARFGLNPSARPTEMLLLLPDGHALGGADGLVQIARRIWWAWPLFALAQLPGMLPVLRTVYRHIAARRNCLGGPRMNSHASLMIQRPRFQLPAMRGVIERRMLVNFHCDPAVLGRLLPAPFRPQLVQGRGMAGICLIRLGGLAPAFLPLSCGLTSENAAHRIAVEWDENGVTREGVYIPRRDTNAWLNRLAGGTIFPGIHHAAKFEVAETRDRFELKMRAHDERTFVQVRARLADGLPAGSVFGSLAAASKFFRGGALGWSVRTAEDGFDGLELCCREWRMEPLAVEHVESNFFGDQELFPAGTAVFDSAFLMRNIAHEWRALGKLTVLPEATV